MATDKIPVSLDFFKKYTYYEEWVDFMFKIKANGNQEAYDAIANNNIIRELALKKYYEAFYLKPKIRREYHIRIKSVPKRIKDKLLSTPVLDTSTGTETVTECKNEDINKTQQQLVISSFDNISQNDVALKENFAKREKSKRRILLPSQEVCVDQLVEDDSEPLTSDVETTILPNTHEKLKSSPEELKEKVSSSSKATIDKEFSNNCVMEKVNEENPTISSDMQQNNEKITTISKVSFPTSTNNTSKLNYKDLIPYIHCCPLTLKEFCKYSNINKLVREFCEKQKGNAGQRRIILDRFYILFYLAPEHRNITPFNKIQMLDNCPSHIKDKFFSIPTRLYLKEQNDSNAPNDVNPATNSMTGPQINVPAAVNRLGEKPSVKNNSNEKLENTTQQNIQPMSKAADNVISNVRCEKNNAIEQIINSAHTIHSIMSSNNCNDVNTIGTTQHVIIPAPTIPVSLDEFKKYTHYEEIVEKLFRIKAQNNEELYIKYKNSQEAFANTLENYYRAFYFLPMIREICPIRTKPMPNFLKKRLISIPEGVNVTSLNNFKLEQLVSPELNIPDVCDQELINRNLSVEKPIKKQSKEVDAANKSIVCVTSPSSSNVKTIKIEKDTAESLENKSNSLLVGSKRASNEVNESPSPKRQKIPQAQDDSNKNEKTKQSYKELLCYAHCCPISFSEFCKYTNISELFSGYCQKRYKSVNKLPFILKRAYILYYLAPKNRSLKPFINLKVLDNCPIHLRNKIFEIPTNLSLRDKKINGAKVETETQTETETIVKMGELKTACEQQKSKTSRTLKEPIKILENRLLSPAKLPIFGHFSNEGRCLNMTCVFHHISDLDFMKQTNILSILPRPHEITSIQNNFKKFVYKIIKEQGCDDKYIVNGALLCKLLKYNNICDKCENDVQTLLNLNIAMESSESENERVPNPANKSISEGCHINNERTQSTTESKTIEEDASHDAVIAKSLKANQTETLANGSQVQQETAKPQHKDLCEYLRKDKIFSVFCGKLLEKLNQSFDGTIDFSSEIYKIFLKCNEIPLRQILNEFSDNKEDVVQRILNEKELCDALQRYYYSKYLTNTNFALKYPVKIKQIVLPENCFKTKGGNSVKSLNGNEYGRNNNNLVRKETNPNSSKTALIQATNMEKVNSNKLTLNQEKISNNNNTDLEKAKRIFFRNVEKTNTLFYVLRTSFGLKQLILRSVLSLTFKEFLKNTSIYEGQELYADNYVAECMYRYVFHTPLVWPTNLYIKLEYLCKFLLAKNIRFDDYSTMLTHISPKLLHWSVLLACTNFVDCVKIDFERRTGKLLDTYDTKSLKKECIEYYNRCWKHEKWLGQVPLVNEEFYKEFSNANNQGDVTMLDEPAVQRVSRNDVTMLDKPAVQRVCNEPAETSSNVVVVANKDMVSNVLSEDEVEVTANMETTINADRPEVTAYMETTINADRPVAEFNCIMLPNTQNQIEMLPIEDGVLNDPLHVCNRAINLNISSSGDEMSDEVVSVGELTQPLKTEPIDKKLLSNLLFYEDDNSNLQCIPCEEEIYDLDNTLKSRESEENLPPSEIDFEEPPRKYILSDVSVNSDNSNTLKNLAQQPSSGEDSDATVNAQQFNQQPQTVEKTLAYLRQLPEVSLTSSGENDNPESVQDPEKKERLNLELDFGGVFRSVFDDTNAFSANSPEVNIVNEKHPSPLITIEPSKTCDQPSDVWVSRDNSNSLKTSEQQPSSSEDSDATVNAQQFNQQPQTVEKTLTYLLQLPEVSLRSSGEKDNPENVQDPEKKEKLNLELDFGGVFRSVFDDTNAFSGNLNAEHANSPFQQQEVVAETLNTPLVPTDEQQEVNIVNEKHPSPLITIEPCKTCDQPSDVWVNRDNSNSLKTSEQQPSSSEDSDATVNAQQFNQQPQTVEKTLTYLLQLPEVSLRSSGEKDNPENVQDPEKKEKLILELDFGGIFRSVFDDTNAFSGNLNAEHANSPFQQQEVVAETLNTPLVPTDEQQEVNIVNEKHPSPLITIEPCKTCDQPSDVWVNRDNSNSLKTSEQQPSSSEDSDATVNAQQFNQQPRTVEKTLTYLLQLPEVSLRSSGEKDNPENVQDPEKKEKLNLEFGFGGVFRSVFDDTNAFSGNLNAEHANSPFQQQEFVSETLNTPLVPTDEQQEVNIVNEKHPSPLITIEPCKTCDQPSDVWVNRDNSNSLKTSEQQPSSSEDSDATVNAQQFNQQPQTDEKTLTYLLQLPEVSLRSSGEKDNPESVQDPEKNEKLILELDFGGIFRSVFDDTNEFNGNLTAEHTSSQFQQREFVAETLNTPLVSTDEQQEVNIVNDQHPSPLITIETSKTCDQPSNTTEASLPIRPRVKRKTNVTNKIKKDIGKVKPLHNSPLVPQIQHNTRPLQTKPLHTTSSSKDNNDLHPGSTLLKLSLAPTKNTSNPTEQPSKNARIQLQLLPIGTHIYISQELNTDCSVFDNTSLLRIVDHECYHQNTTNSTLATSQTKNKEKPENTDKLEVPPTSNTSQQQTARRSTRRNSMCPINNTSSPSQNINKESDKTYEQPARRVLRKSSMCTVSNTQPNAINDSKQQVSPRIVARSTSSLHKDTNDKVNNIDLTCTNNPVAAITPTIYQPYHHHSYKMVRKLCLHRLLNKFHYFKELTSQHISEYLLPSSEIGKSYTEALIVSENFKTRISNRSISALFPFWPPNLQRDFLLVLDDLKEFHYDVYDRVSMKRQEDLRARILFWLLNTAPSFAFCQIIYEANNTEFSHCEAIKNGNNPSYKRKPFKCLTNALSPKVLDKLRDLKLNLKKN